VISKMKRKQIEYEGFPQVWKMGNLVQIVYRNHSELYELTHRYSDSGEDDNGKKKKFDPYNEIQMIKGNGGKRVHGMKTVKVIDFTR